MNQEAVVEYLSAATDKEIREIIRELESIDKWRIWRIICDCKQKDMWRYDD